MSMSRDISRGVHIVVMDIMSDVRYSFDLLLTSVDLGICARERKPMRYLSSSRGNPAVFSG